MHTRFLPVLITFLLGWVFIIGNTSAWVQKQGDVWLLTFTEQSCYAGHSLRFGGGVIQLPLPLFKDIHFSHF